METKKPTPIVGPLAALLRSRKVMLALVALLAAIVVALIPELQNVEAELIVLITFVASVIIGGTAAEDVAKLRSDAVVKAAQPTETRIRDAVQAVLDELLQSKAEAPPVEPTTPEQKA
jgi:4-hydroxybenzoate polyprenyltransferase